MKQAGRSTSTGKASASKLHLRLQTPYEKTVLEQPANYVYVRKAFHTKDIKANQQKKT